MTYKLAERESFLAVRTLEQAAVHICKIENSFVNNHF